MVNMTSAYSLRDSVKDADIKWTAALTKPGLAFRAVVSSERLEANPLSLQPVLLNNAKRYQFINFLFLFAFLN